MADKGILITFSGPSGSGKDTLMVELFKKRPEIKFSISSITRGMREGEVEGVKYNFISKEQFEKYMMATGEMATDVGTILYGKEAVAFAHGARVVGQPCNFDIGTTSLFGVGDTS